jgi:hypothetical protein
MQRRYSARTGLQRGATRSPGIALRCGKRAPWEVVIPAFHGVIDDEFGANAHDDPQNFDLELWAARLQNLLNDLNH